MRRSRVEVLKTAGRGSQMVPTAWNGFLARRFGRKHGSRGYQRGSLRPVVYIVNETVNERAGSSPHVAKRDVDIRSGRNVLHNHGLFLQMRFVLLRVRINEVRAQQPRNFSCHAAAITVPYTATAVTCHPRRRRSRMSLGASWWIVCAGRLRAGIERRALCPLLRQRTVQHGLCADAGRR